MIVGMQEENLKGLVSVVGEHCKQEKRKKQGGFLLFLFEGVLPVSSTLE